MSRGQTDLAMMLPSAMQLHESLRRRSVHIASVALATHTALNRSGQARNGWEKQL